MRSDGGPGRPRPWLRLCRGVLEVGMLPSEIVRKISSGPIRKRVYAEACPQGRSVLSEAR
jgi:hypothetical protein